MIAWLLLSSLVLIVIFIYLIPLFGILFGKDKEEK